MSFIKRNKFLIFFLALVLFTLSFAQVQAARSILPPCADAGNCTVCDMVQVVINIGLFLLGVSGAITLAFIVYGGYVLLTSGGASDKVGKGKKILVNSAVGLTIAFSAYLIITTFVAVVTDEWNWENELKCSSRAIERTIDLA
ncbi:hypothetical protein ACFL2U_00360 [Patescibacteria group bacterium]